ncbi:endoplasmic reticulum protein [Coprinopsis sp. MPI-PUGE-AT-0042]|nr:endoplasmic reticulum protein [Coprinopsis sp. MPI-PUGE-AT-0042]
MLSTSWLLLSLFLTPLSATANQKLRGVDPALLNKYSPSSKNTWTCLDGSKEIAWSAVNDDFCDCRDGSDEPGTSACPNTRFYCENAGHVGSFIPSSRVGDGLCETECCDGSDEQPGVCPNRCREIGEAHRAKQEAEDKLRRTGAKIRASYIAHAHQEKTRLEKRLEELTKEIEAKALEVEKLRDVAERTESISQAALEFKKESPLYKSMITHNTALKSLEREYKKHLEREKALGQILDSLRTGYNPNYQDMAVLEAVRGWEELAGLPHINDVKKGDSATTDDITVNEVDVDADESSLVEDIEEEKPVDDGLWTKEQLDLQLQGVINTDYTNLLLEHEEHIGQPAEDTLLWDVTNYLPSSLLPIYEETKESFLTLLEKLSIIRSDSSSSSNAASAEAQRAQNALTQAQSALTQLQTQKSKVAEDIKEVFSVEKFGKRGEWKKLDNACIEHNAGDYIYELCLFKEAKQKPQSGSGQTFSLGRFDGWNNAEGVEKGSIEYYSKQYYKRGTRCWNGPERSVVVLLTCGTENAVTSVQELEKCEYQFTATTPALCLPLEGSKGSAGKDEL